MSEYEIEFTNLLIFLGIFRNLSALCSEPVKPVSSQNPKKGTLR